MIYLFFQNELLENMIAATLKLLNSIQTLQFHSAKHNQAMDPQPGGIFPSLDLPSRSSLSSQASQQDMGDSVPTIGRCLQHGATRHHQDQIYEVKNTFSAPLLHSTFFISFRLEPLFFHAQTCLITF